MGFYSFSWNHQITQDGASDLVQFELCRCVLQWRNRGDPVYHSEEREKSRDDSVREHWRHGPEKRWHFRISLAQNCSEDAVMHSRTLPSDHNIVKNH